MLYAKTPLWINGVRGIERGWVGTIQYLYNRIAYNHPLNMTEVVHECAGLRIRCKSNISNHMAANRQGPMLARLLG